MEAICSTIFSIHFAPVAPMKIAACLAVINAEIINWIMPPGSVLPVLRMRAAALAIHSSSPDEQAVLIPKNLLLSEAPPNSPTEHNLG